MEVLATGSRGAVRLHLQKRRSTDNGNTTFIESQRWAFQTQPALQPLQFSQAVIQTQKERSIRIRLTSPTALPSSLTKLSLYPGDDAEEGSSVDADILAAQRFLQQYHPDLEVSDTVLSHIINENALTLAETGHALDGSLGLADAQAVAVLGPIVHKEQRVYGVVCVGGPDRNWLLLHRLEIHSVSVTEAKAASAEGPSISKDKGKARATDPPRLRFVPAHDAARKYATPILQIVASSNNQHLAVRTHSATSFISLQHESDETDAPYLHLQKVHDIKYGTDGFTQHHDICFSSTKPTLAAAVDRLGRIDFVDLEASGQPGHSAEPASASPHPHSSIDPRADLTSGKSRRTFRHTSSTSTSVNLQSSPTITVDRIDVQSVFRAQDNGQAMPADGESDVEVVHAQQSYLEPPFRILFGASNRDLFLLSRHILLQIRTESSSSSVDAEVGPEIKTLLRASFSVSSFRRARFFSMALSPLPDCDDSILAVCSADMIYWIDTKDPTRPLFTTAHHRGDDPTLTLMELSPVAQLQDGANSDGQALLWSLSSRRNELVSCYTVRVSLSPSSVSEGDPKLTQDDATGDIRSIRRRCQLDPAPALIPLTFDEMEKKGAPPLFFGAEKILRHGSDSNFWLAFDITDRGALSLQMTNLHVAGPGEDSNRVGAIVFLEVTEPRADTLLYIENAAESSAKRNQAGSVEDVQTKIVGYQQLYQALFAQGDTSEAAQRNALEAVSTGNKYLVSLQSNPTKGDSSIEATTLSLGQLLRNVTNISGTDAQDSTKNRNAIASFWSAALGFDTASEAVSRFIPDLSREARHVLSFLGTSSSQSAWSRSANVDGSLDQNGHRVCAAKPQSDLVEKALAQTRGDTNITPYLPTCDTAQSWRPKEQHAMQKAMRSSSKQMTLDLALEAEVFLRPKVRLLDEGASTQRPQQRPGTNWTAFEHRNVYHFVEEQGSTIPPPRVGSVGLSFFTPLRTGDVGAAAGSSEAHDDIDRGLNDAELETLLPSTSSTARLLLAEWQLGEDPTEYRYLDPFEGLHRLPRASRLRGPTARARSRSFSRASSASTEDRSRSRSRSRKASVPMSFSQSGAFASQGASSSYPSSVVSQSQPAGPSSGAPPTLISRRKRQQDTVLSRSQPVRESMQGFDRGSSTPERATRPSMQQTPLAAQSQPAAPRFGFAGSFGDLTPTVSPASSQVGTPIQAQFATSTQIEAGRFGARPAKADRPPKKKKRASGF